MSVFRYSGLFMPPGGSKPGPPEPPETATMAFRTQPTNTNVDEWFDPWITVEVSDGRQGDTISLSSYSGTCSMPVATAVTNASGYALFPGLSAGSTPGQGCRLRARNLTRPGIPDIISNPFDVIAPAVSPWTFVNSASSGGSLSAEATAVTLNTIGATDLFVITLAIAVTGVSLSDSEGNAWVYRGAFGDATVGQLRLYTASKPIQVSANHYISLGAGYPAMAVFAFQQRTDAAQWLVDGNSGGVAGTAISVSPPMMIPFPTSLVLSAYGDNNWSARPITPPPGFAGMESVPIAGFSNGNLVAGFKMLNEPATEHAVWTVSAGGLSASVILGAFEG